MKVLESTDLIEEVRNIADEFPDERYYGEIPTGEYDAGYYIRYGRVSCLLAQALGELGLSEDELGKFENKKVSKIVKTLFKKYTMTDLLWLDTVQRKHDTNHSYAEAVAFADLLFLGE
ncbi:hypothetical protein PBI_PEREGRIN_203 [Rhodococcus phage Peregrin]|jgi:hypothetical protein|nr:hypothetical protein PBI_PEREGRIN_203 [Rhodococcus phage Peregrin]